MRTPSDELFQLIKSLTKQEKRYLKLFAQRHVIGDQNKYLLLFDEIDAQDEYDELAIKKKFKGEKFTNQLHVIKNYLTDLIMRSLRNFHAANNEDQFHDLLRDAQILYHKGLHKMSRKVLNKARKSAVENERYLQLLDIYKLEHNIIHLNNDVARLEKYVAEDFDKEIQLLDNYKNLLQFKLLNDKFFIRYWRNGIARNNEEKEKYTVLLNDEIYSEEENARSFEAKFYYYNALYTNYFCTGQHEECHEVMSRLISMIEAKPDGTSVHASKYINALNNFYVIQKELKKNTEALTTLRKLREVPVKSLTQKAEIFMRSYVLELDLYISTGDFVTGYKVLSEVENDLNKFSDVIDKQSKLAFYYNFTYICFGVGEYKKSLTWSNTLLNDSDLSMREDIHCFARILNLLIHYELGNSELLEYIVKSTYRYLQNRKRLFKVETIILKFLKKYPYWMREQELMKGFHELYDELLKLKDDSFEKHAFEYFDFISWLESKNKSLDFAELVKEKALAA